MTNEEWTKTGEDIYARLERMMVPDPHEFEVTDKNDRWVRVIREPNVDAIGVLLSVPVDSTTTNLHPHAAEKLGWALIHLARQEWKEKGRT